MAVGDILPIVIGKGDKPRIWLQALADPKTKEFISVVEDSESKHPSVKVLEQDGAIKVILSSAVVLSVKTTGEDGYEIEALDMRPLGLNLHGTTTELMVGSNTFSGNFMSGVGTFISLGE